MKTSLLVTALVIVIIIVAGGYYLINSTHTSSGITATSTVAQSSATTSIASTGGGSTVAASTSTINQTSSGTFTVMVASNSTYGNYLADGSGKTLYYYKSDVQNSGVSACTGGCAAVWPPFYTATVTVPKTLNASLFGTTSSGTKQTTYNGYPLYYYAGDSNAGQINGQNLQNFFVVQITSVQTNATAQVSGSTVASTTTPAPTTAYTTTVASSSSVAAATTSVAASSWS
jgi:predicted lipoprotein with Yx(FWY)xxD motif